MEKDKVLTLSVSSLCKCFFSSFLVIWQFWINSSLQSFRQQSYHGSGWVNCPGVSSRGPGKRITCIFIFLQGLICRKEQRPNFLWCASKWRGSDSGGLSFLRVSLTTATCHTILQDPSEPGFCGVGGLLQCVGWKFLKLVRLSSCVCGNPSVYITGTRIAIPWLQTALILKIKHVSQDCGKVHNT